MIGIKYKDKSFDVEPGLRVKDLIKQAEGGDRPEILAAKVNGRLLDMNAPVQGDAHLEPVTFDSPEGREVYWHSSSHLMAAAVKRLWPEVKVAIGPAIEQGFYYDFDRDDPFTEAELSRIEEEMRKVMKDNAPFIRKEIPLSEAIKMFESRGELYKVEILREIKDDMVSLYTVGDFTDLCRGPHIPASKKVKAIKLMKVAGAYWRGDERNKMLQRIYGISFPNQEQLDAHLKNIEEAKQRDHRKLGKELDLFSLHEEVGPGLVYWHPKGAIIRKEMEDFWRAEHLKRGYDLLYTPHLAKVDLWDTSGHTGFFKDNLFPPMEMDKSDYMVKPMNCPFHILIYKTAQRSYRELPLRWAELGTVYRYEKAGVLHGLMRVRGFTQDDAHIFMREDQLGSEIDACLDIIAFMLKTFGFSEYDIYLSTMPEEHIGEVAVWARAEAALRQSLEKAGLAYQVDKGGGAFYGPKIDIKIKDALGRVWQCSTLQVDFNEPERFDITYRGNDGRDHRVIMLHRALLGSLERFFGVLIEHYKGAFPLWLSPVQAAVLTVTEKAQGYAEELVKTLREGGLRVSLDDSGDKIGAKIRNATLQKIPYMLIIGEKELESRTVSLRRRTGEEQRGVAPADFLAAAQAKIKARETAL